MRVMLITLVSVTKMTMPGRLKAGQRFLVPYVGVRVLPGQHDLTIRKGCIFRGILFFNP